jgi:hypothetical protein
MGRAGRQLTFSEAQEFLNLKREDLTATLLRSWFAANKNQDDPKYQTYDKIVLPKDHPHCFNETEIVTTLGRFLFNFFALPDVYLKKHGYVNETIDGGKIGDIESKMASMLLNDEITVQEYGKYFDNAEWMLMGMAYYLAPSVNYAMNVAPKEIINHRNELFEKYAKEVKAGDSNVGELIEKSVVDKAKDYMKNSGNDAFDLFNSGEFKMQNYKKTSLMAGMIENPYSHKLSILKSNYTEGIQKDEYVNFPLISLLGGYSRGVETANGGYQSKRIQNATQNVVLDEPGSDCGTTEFLVTPIFPSLKNMYTYRYILQDNGQLLELTPENISQYIGKTVKMRSPLFCKGEHVCSKCAGSLFYRMGVKNAGLLTSNFSSVLMNLFMKKFHDTSVKFKKIDISSSIKKL